MSSTTVFRLLGIVVVVGIAIVGIAVRDQLTGAAGDLRVGECFDAVNSGRIDDVQHKPCNQPHTGEVIAVFDYPNPPSEYPGETDFEAVFRVECLEKAFPSYTGLAFDSPDADSIDAGYYYPLEENWGSDKEITCFVGPRDGTPVSTSFKAAS
jgi:hypothetical protein